MLYTKNYYDVLGLEAPSWRSATPVSQNTIRKAYRLALLAAHPDKAPSLDTQNEYNNVKVVELGGGNSTNQGYTIDDVKEAYQVLVDEKSRSEYDKWLASTHNGNKNIAGVDSDFILGLELLDLNDFEVVVDDQTASSMCSPKSGSSPASDEEKMQWRRACRCGHEEGFKITEEELEDAERRGEKEVLVGCEGCSLWVRVGFEVEED